MGSLGLIACSGPGAGRAIAEAIRYGYVSAGITFALLGATAALYHFVRRNPRAALLNFSPIAIHPAWTVSALNGDCGFAKVEASNWSIGLAVCLFMVSAANAGSRGRAERKAADFQFSIRSVLILTLAVAGLLALPHTQYADFVYTIGFFGLIGIALKPIAFLRSVMDNRRQAQLALRDRVQASRDLSEVPTDVVIDSRVSDGLRR